MEVIEKTKLLGTIFTNDLKWDENTADLVRRANGRMQMLRKTASFFSRRPKGNICAFYKKYFGTICSSLAQ